MKKALALIASTVLTATSFTGLSAENNFINHDEDLFYLTFFVQDGNKSFAIPNLATKEGKTGVFETNTSFGVIKMGFTPKSNDGLVDVDWDMALMDNAGQESYVSSNKVKVGYHQILNLTNGKPIMAGQPYSDISVTMQVTRDPN